MQRNKCNTINATTVMKHVIENYFVLDSGTIGNFITIKAEVKDVCPTSKAINVDILDGRTIQSKHECDIDEPLLPTTSRGHVIPNFAQKSLISVVQICCMIPCNVKISMLGIKCPKTNFW